MEVFTRYFTASFFITYMCIAIVLPSVRTYRKTGVNPITFGKSDNVHDYIGKPLKVLFSLIPLTIIISWIGGIGYQFFLPATYLQRPSIYISGVVCCIASLVWTAIAQYHMNKSWRIGIDEKNQTELVKTGLFKLSRNPIFLGMETTLLGFFFLLPNAVTLLVLVAGIMLIQIQVRLEETFLHKQHGTEYEQYKKRVRRFI